jgi:acyl-CoA synthetase (AMP-forming)/AMP-acid ligase II
MAVDADALATRSVVRPAAGGQTVVFTSCGPLVDGVELRIDATGSADEPGIAAGEVMLRGGFLFQGYYNQPALTADVITDGWFRTGDIGFVADGELFICGRSKDILIVHGRNYYAHDIEAVASAVPGVIAGRVVAIGQYTETTGSEELVLIAETRMSPADAALLKRALKQAVVETLGLLPRVVKLVPPGWLVKTTSGKISRKANLERFEHESLELEASHAG